MSCDSKLLARVGGHRLRRDRDVALAGRAWRRTRREHTTAAAAPQVGGQHCSRVSGPKMCGEASTSSTVTGSRNTAYGLFAACRRAFTEILAKISGSVPYCRRRYSRPRRRRTAPASGACVQALDRARARRRTGASGRAVGEHRGQRARHHLLEAERERAVDHAAAPPGGPGSADEPVEQLLFTLTIGMPVWPSP